MKDCDLADQIEQEIEALLRSKGLETSRSSMGVLEAKFPESDKTFVIIDLTWMIADEAGEIPDSWIKSLFTS